MHYSKEKPSCSTFRVITANFRVSEILGFLRYHSNDPKFSDWPAAVLANSVDPDQTDPEAAV